MKKSAIVMGIVCGIAGTAWIAVHGRGSEDTDSAREAADEGRSEPRSGGRRWLPWQTGPKVEVAPEIVEADASYEGPWLEVPVHVVDLEGRPVSGATVEVRANLEEWATAGMTDEQYDAWLEAQDEPESEESESERAYEEFEPARAVVATGRTDRKGTFQARVKPEIELLFQARDGKAEGKAEPYIAFQIDEYANEYATEEESEDESEDEAEGLAPVTIEIGELAVLSGIVQDENGRPIAGAFLDLWPLDADSTITDMVTLVETGEDEDPYAAFETSEDGRFHIRLRAWGAFEVSIEADGARRHTEPVVQLLPGRETELSLTLEAVAELAGQVVDERGLPVAQATVSVIEDGGASSFTTGADGTFVVDAPPGSRLQITAQGFRPAVVDSIDGATIRLSRGGAVAVSIAVSSEVRNEGVASIAVYIASPEGNVPVATGNPDPASPHSISQSGRYLQNVALDENGQGVATIGGLPPGRFIVTLVAGAAAIVHSSVTVHDGGETALTASIPDVSSGVLEGTVRAATSVAGGSLYLTQPGSIGLHTRVLEGGTFRFGSVPAGEWTLAGNIEAGGAYAQVEPVVVAVGRSERRTLEVRASEPLARPAWGGDGELNVDAVAFEGEEYEEEPGRFRPDLYVEELETGLVVMRAAGPGKKLFGGDKILSIDGDDLSVLEDWERYDRLFGGEGSMCRIVAVRPATGETISVSLARTLSEDDGYYH